MAEILKNLKHINLKSTLLLCTGWMMLPFTGRARWMM